MLTQIYIHHYRCLQNFSLKMSDLQSVLILGKNGSGKSSLLQAIDIFQKIGQGISSIEQLVKPEDFSFNDHSKSMLLEINLNLDSKHYSYHLELALPETFHSIKIEKEWLKIDGQEVFIRSGGKTNLYNKAEFTLDWHHIGLPLIALRSTQEPIAIFRRWLAAILVLTPVPEDILSTCNKDNPLLNGRATNLAQWMNYHLSVSPALYQNVTGYLRQQIPDFQGLRWEITGKEERQLLIQFKGDTRTILSVSSLGERNSIELSLERLSDGEKIYLLCAMLLSIIESGAAILCLWDEIDHHISLPELAQFIMTIRRAFESGNSSAQIIITTHNPRVIYEFSNHNSFILTRSSHSQPTRIRLLQDISYTSPDTVQAYENGELDDGH